MASRAARPCSVPGCANLAYDKVAQCRDCRARADRHKGSAARRGYDREWSRIRAEYLRYHPFCQWPDCERPPREVDHIDGDTSNCVWDNLRALCPYHHKLRTARDQPGGAVLN